MKDSRIQPKGWPAEAHVLGIKSNLASLLAELGASGESILFIDGIDKITDPAVQVTVNDILRTIETEQSLSSWRVLVTVREQNLQHLATWLDEAAMAKMPLRTVTVPSFNHDELAR